MKTTNTVPNEMIDELLEVLDAEKVRIESTLQSLDRIRAAVIKKDEDDLRIHLDEIRGSQARQLAIDNRRTQIRRRLATLLDCDVDQLNLSYLCQSLDDRQQSQILKKQQELKHLVDKLRIEHRATMMLLNDCARLNRLLLHNLLGESTPTTTYNSRGDSSLQRESQLVSMRL